MARVSEAILQKMRNDMFRWKLECSGRRWNVQVEGGMFRWKVQCSGGRWNVQVEVGRYPSSPSNIKFG